MRALLYLRQSDKRRGESEDNSLSLDTQETLCRARCEREGWEIVGVIKDHDRTGDDPARPGMLDVKRRAANREMDAVVVLNLSRFARDNVFQEIAWRELRGWGVAVVSLAEPNTDHTLFRGVMGVINQYQREELGRTIAGVIRARARQGQSSGTAAYGFRRVPVGGENGTRPVFKLVPHEEEARIVLTIFQRYSAGWSIGALVRWLNADPTVPPRPRGRWSRAAVAALLRIETYAGVVSITGEGSPGFAAVRVEDAHEAIVDRATFDRVQRRLNSGAPRSREDKREHSWMEGIVYCAGCGEPMYFVARKHGTGVERAWHCRRAVMHQQGTRPTDCPAAKAKAGAGWVARAVDARIGHDLARAGTATDADLRRFLPRQDDKRIVKVGAEIANLTKERDNLIAAIRTGAGLAEVLGPVLSSTVRQIADLERERSGLRAGTTLSTLREAKARAASFASAWAKADAAVKREAALRMGLRIEVGADERKVTLRYGDGYEWLAGS